eukprot:1415437-Rhodomonas_salina.1
MQSPAPTHRALLAPPAVCVCHAMPAPDKHTLALRSGTSGSCSQPKHTASNLTPPTLLASALAWAPVTLTQPARSARSPGFKLSKAMAQCGPRLWLGWPRRSRSSQSGLRPRILGPAPGTLCASTSSSATTTAP